MDQRTLMQTTIYPDVPRAVENSENWSPATVIDDKCHFYHIILSWELSFSERNMTTVQRKAKCYFMPDAANIPTQFWYANAKRRATTSTIRHTYGTHAQ